MNEHLLIVGRGSSKTMSQLILYAMSQPEPLKSELLIAIENVMEGKYDGIKQRIDHVSGKQSF